MHVSVVQDVQTMWLSLQDKSNFQFFKRLMHNGLNSKNRWLHNCITEAINCIFLYK